MLHRNFVEARMNDFKQRVNDYRRYRREHWMDGVVLKGIPVRSLCWFLFQSVEQRSRREEEEIRALEALLDIKQRK